MVEDFPAGGKEAEPEIDEQYAHLNPETMEPVDAWERQPGETLTQFHAFCHYRDLKGRRSVRRAYNEHREKCEHRPVPDPNKYPPKRWFIWSVQWGWVDRVAKHEDSVDRETRERLIKLQVEARERHARMAQATLTVLTTPVRAALEAIKDQNVLATLTQHAKTGPHTFHQALMAISRVAQVIPGLVTVERLALGLNTDAVVVDDRVDADAGIADRIASDPEATALAIQLLNKMAEKKPEVASESEPAPSV